MKLTSYLKDKIYALVLFLFVYFILLLLFLAFKIDKSLLVVTSIILVTFMFSLLGIDYLRKRTFYREILQNIERLEKSYLVLETVFRPSFYEGELFYQALYEINKSMRENMKVYEEQMNDFKEYIEMWIHEVKIPISSLTLMAHNHPEQFDKKSREQMMRINDYVEQVLYYVRSENAEKDYLIKEVSLEKVISMVALKNKDDLLENEIDFRVMQVSFSVLTDAKWLEFILDQIINNSMKYRKRGKSSWILISAFQDGEETVLTIEDNGIGIPASDISRVFEKSFTGHNGRTRAKSTGMGLFIAKNLCTKLGHKIEIESKEKEYTKVSITFSQNKYYEVVK